MAQRSTGHRKLKQQVGFRRRNYFLDRWLVLCRIAVQVVEH